MSWGARNELQANESRYSLFSLIMDLFVWMGHNDSLYFYQNKHTRFSVFVSMSTLLNHNTSGYIHGFSAKMILGVFFSYSFSSLFCHCKNQRTNNLVLLLLHGFCFSSRMIDLKMCDPLADLCCCVQATATATLPITRQRDVVCSVIRKTLNVM